MGELFLGSFLFTFLETFPFLVQLKESIFQKFTLRCVNPSWLRCNMAFHWVVACNCRATSFAKYVIMMSAPARFIEVRTSIVTAFSSIHPLFPAALIMAYSPLTLYAASGVLNWFRA